MKQINIKKKTGFSILAIILVIVAVVVAIGIWALSGQSNTSSNSDSSAKIAANAVINDGAAIRLEFNKLKIQGNSISKIVFSPNTASTPAAPNILDTVNGMTAPKISAKAIKDSPSATEGYWVYNKATFNPGIYIGKISGARDPYPTVLVAGIKDSVCIQINSTLNGYPKLYVSESPLASSATITTGATTTNPNTTYGFDMSLDLSEDAARWTSGCVKVSSAPDNNFYFQILDMH